MILKLRHLLHYKTIIAIIFLTGLVLFSFRDQGLFHLTAEVFCIVVSASIFMLIWNSRRFLDNEYFLIIGVSYLFIGVLDFLHLAAKNSVGFLNGAELSAQLWIVSRYIQAGTILAAPFFVRHKAKMPIVFAVFISVMTLAMVSIFVWKNFPVAYFSDYLPTNFSVFSEYLIIAMMLGGTGLLYVRRNEFDKNVLALLYWSFGIIALAELFFTAYIGLRGTANTIGHVLRMIAFALLYEAVIARFVSNPFAILFRGLKESEVTLKKEIVERRKIETQLVESNKQRDDFLFQTIHDLRIPTHVIQMILDVYRQKESFKQNREFDKDVKLIERANAQMKNLISDLFSIAAGEKTEIIFKKERVDLERAIRDNLKLIEPVIKEKNISVEHQTPFTKAIVWADPDRINEILINVLDNAIKYNKFSGRLMIGYEKTSDSVKVRIKDTGIGVAEEDMAKIFNPYFRSNFSGNVGGTGLGLYIVKKLVEKMNGRIEAESKKDLGTTIIISLPAAEPE